jgi:hypothetical protein
LFTPRQKASDMATVREGTQGALLVVDVQVDVMKDMSR